MIDDCNINNLAKNQVSAVFNSRAIRRSVSSKFIEICMGRHVGAHLDGHQHGGRKPTETSVTEFYYKSVNLSLEELKNIKIILFLIQKPVFIGQFVIEHIQSCSLKISIVSENSLPDRGNSALNCSRKPISHESRSDECDIGFQV